MDKDWILDISKYEKRILTQRGQGGVLEFIFKNLKPQNNPPYCVEFGFNSETFEGVISISTSFSDNILFFFCIYILF